MTVSDISFYHVFCAFSGIKPVWNGQKKFNWKYWNGTKKKIQPRIRDVFFLQNKYWFCFSCPASTADKYPNVLQPLAFCPENTLYKKSLGMKKHKVFRTYRVHNHYFPIAAEDPCQISVQSLSALQLIKTPHCILSMFYNRDKQQLPVLVQHSTYLSDHVLHGRCLYGKRGAVKEKEKAWTEKWRQREREMLRVRRGSYHSLPAADCQSSSLIMSSGVYAHKIHASSIQRVSIRKLCYTILAVSLHIPLLMLGSVFSSSLFGLSAKLRWEVFSHPAGIGRALKKGWDGNLWKFSNFI